MSKFEPRYKDLVTLFQDTVSRNANRPVFGTKKDGRWEWITYGDFARLVEQTRGGLARLGVGAGDRVAVISNNRVEWAVGAYATYGLGASYVPMYEAQQAKEWQYILADCGAKVALAATPAIAATINGVKGELPALASVVCFDAPASSPDSFAALLAEGKKHPVPSVAADPAALCGYLYTSGTTGNPKGVLLTHSNLACNVSAAIATFPILPEDRSLSFLPWAHSFGQTAELHTMLAAGASMGICEGIPKIIDNLAEVQPSILMAVPNIFNKIYDGVQKQMTAKPSFIRALFRTGLTAQNKKNEGESLSLGETLALPLAKKLIFSKVVAKFGGRLRYALSGGAALSKDVAKFVDALGISVFEGYGLTETSPVATVNSPVARRIGSVGKPIPGVQVKILDPDADGQAVELPQGSEGEVVVYGHNVMQGYYNLPEETAAVFTADRGFRTGDLGYIDPDGFVVITGRIKELYKLENGKYVAPVALESKLDLSPFILRSMVYGANKAYNVVVIVPKFESLQEWAATQGIDASDPVRLVEDDKVRNLFRGEIDKCNAGFKAFEVIKDFVVVPEDFTVESGLLTPKQSMKRRNVVKRYQAEIDAMYSGRNGRAKVATG